MKNIRKNFLTITLLFITLLLLPACQSSNSAGVQEKSGTNAEIDIPLEQLTDEENESVNTAIEQSNTSEAETSEQDEEEPQTVSLVMVGDVLLHTPVSESGKLSDGTYNYDHLFAHVRDKIESADIAIANQEVILGGTELGLSGYPCFNGAYEVGDALAASGFDVILHATNHALDKGEKGVRSCLAFWKENYPQMQIAGINESGEEQENHIVIIEKNDIRVAILNYTYGTNGILLPSSAPYLVNLLDKDRISKDIARAKEQADFVVVCPHWGTEYQHQPDKSQHEWTTYFAKQGVDLVLGTHPHVIEPVEWVEGEDGHRMLVYYSLGNFVNATSGTGAGVADRMLGAMAEVVLTKQEDGNVEISSYEALPLVSHLESGVQKITFYPLENYTEELEQKNEIVLQDSAFSMEYLENVWNDVF